MPVLLQVHSATHITKPVTKKNKIENHLLCYTFSCKTIRFNPFRTIFLYKILRFLQKKILRVFFSRSLNLSPSFNSLAMRWYCLHRLPAGVPVGGLWSAAPRTAGCGRVLWAAACLCVAPAPAPRSSSSPARWRRRAGRADHRPSLSTHTQTPGDGEHTQQRC